MSLRVWTMAMLCALPALALAGCSEQDGGGSETSQPTSTSTATAGPRVTGGPSPTGGPQPTSTGSGNGGGSGNNGGGSGGGGQRVVAPPPPNLFQCGDVTLEEAHVTFGQDAQPFEDLSWAALKTGFRFAVAWTTAASVAASIEVSVDGGSPQTHTELRPRNVHLFVLDGLPEGATLCFTAKAGSDTSAVHAVRLENAHNAYDPATGTYTVNTLTLVNERSTNLGAIRQGLKDYTNRLYDATDGYVRAGMNMVVIGDYEHHSSGFFTCYVVLINSPLCQRLYDVLFTLDAHPQGAASTRKDGIGDTGTTIWMNWYWQGGPLGDDVGAVLTHEMGHYLFGMDDYYPAATSPTGQDCEDGALGISIMGGSRAATEFDDEVNRCPNEDDFANYTPNWDYLIARYEAVPQRTGLPDPGPTGDGGIAQIVEFTVL